MFLINDGSDGLKFQTKLKNRMYRIFFSSWGRERKIQFESRRTKTLTVIYNLKFKNINYNWIVY